MRRASILVALLATAAACGRPITEILVSVHSDLPTSALAGARILVDKLDGTSLFTQGCVDLTQLAGWPSKAMTLGLVPGSVTQTQFQVTVEGFAQCGASSPTITNSAVVAFAEKERVLLELPLDAACAHVTCAAGDTCNPLPGDPSVGSCVSDMVTDLGPVMRGDMSASGSGDMAPQPKDMSGADLSFPVVAELEISANGAVAWPQVVAVGDGFHIVDVEGASMSGGVLNEYVATAVPQGLIRQTPVPLANYAVDATAPSLATDGTTDVIAFDYRESSAIPSFVTFAGNQFGPPQAIPDAVDTGGHGVHAVTYDAPVFHITIWAGHTELDFLQLPSLTLNFQDMLNDNVAPSAIAAGSYGMGGASVWFSDVLFGWTLDGSAAPVQLGAPEGASPPLAIVSANNQGDLIVVAGSGDTTLQVITYVSGVATGRSAVTPISITAGAQVAAAGDTSGSSMLCVLSDSNGVLSRVPIGGNGVPGAAMPLFNDSVSRTQPAIAYNASLDTYLIVYARKESTDAGGPRLYGFLLSPGP